MYLLRIHGDLMFDILKVQLILQRVEVAVAENQVPGKASLPRVKATMAGVDKMRTKNTLTWIPSTGHTCCFQVR